MPSWLMCLVGIPAPWALTATGVPFERGVLAGVVMMWLLGGTMGTLSLVLLMPLGTAATHARSMWTRQGRPGHARVLLVCVLTSGGGVSVVLLTTALAIVAIRALL